METKDDVPNSLKIIAPLLILITLALPVFYILKKIDASDYDASGAYIAALTFISLAIVKSLSHQLSFLVNFIFTVVIWLSMGLYNFISCYSNYGLERKDTKLCLLFLCVCILTGTIVGILKFKQFRKENITH